MSTLSSQLGGKAVAVTVAIPAAVDTVILSPLDVQRFDRFSLYLVNEGQNIIEQCKLETAPTTDGPWHVVDHNIGVPNIAAGESVVDSYADKSLKYIRVTASSLLGSAATIYLSAGGLE